MSQPIKPPLHAPSSPYHLISSSEYQERVLNRLDKIILLMKKYLPSPATHFQPTTTELPLEDTMANHFYDKVKVHIELNPNGSTDAPPTWTQDNGSVTMEVAADGNSANFIGTADGVVNWTANALADDPETPDTQETVIGGGSFSFSHSKATSFTPAETEIPLV